MMTDNPKIIGSIHKSLTNSIPTQCKNDRKRDKTVGVKINDVSETTATIEETELSENSNNNTTLVTELVNHPNDVEIIDFEVEFECLMIADIEDADADTMLGQHKEVPRQMDNIRKFLDKCFFLLMMQCLYFCLHNHHLRKLPHQWIMVQLTFGTCLTLMYYER